MSSISFRDAVTDSLGGRSCTGGDDVFREATERVFGEEGAKYPVEAVVLIEVERAESLISPGYLHVRTEDEMRSTWRERRSALDAEFEAHVAKEPFQP